MKTENCASVRRTAKNGIFVIAFERALERRLTVGGECISLRSFSHLFFAFLLCGVRTNFPVPWNVPVSLSAQGCSSIFVMKAKYEQSKHTSLAWIGMNGEQQAHSTTIGHSHSWIRHEAQAMEHKNCIRPTLNMIIIVMVADPSFFFRIFLSDARHRPLGCDRSIVAITIA